MDIKKIIVVLALYAIWPVNSPAQGVQHYYGQPVQSGMSPINQCFSGESAVGTQQVGNN